MRAFLLGVLLALLIVPGVPAQAQDRDFDVDIFYEELAPHGDWFEHPRWGLVWQPRVERDWRPYSQGYWTLTEEYGWYWVSDEPFAWAVFHYGRWTYDEDDGWLWIPDTEWGPAWVIWRWSDDYVGWAALGPDSSWDPDGELRYDVEYYESPSYIFAWSFVHPRYLTTPGLHRYLAPRAQHSFILRRTRHVRGYRRFDRRVVNVGIDVRRFERVIGRPVTRVRLKSVDNPRDLRARRDRGGTDVQVFMPRIISRPDGPKRLPQLKARPETKKGTDPSVTGFPKGKSAEPPSKDRLPDTSPRFIPPPSDGPKTFKQTTTPPPTDRKGLPSDVQKQLKQVSPPGPTQTDPSALRKSGPPPSGPSGPPPGFTGQDVRPKDGGTPRVQREGKPSGPPPGGPALQKGPPPPKKDGKDKDKKGEEVK
ncbi:MAG TPA: DUF6600 domain-containing protein [Hyphomicrobiaceae bacterium]|nr:DUF6600 domain-containing protein [Hyphomicrobiaceae bacterium]